MEENAFNPRPRPTATQAHTFIRALVTARRVEPETRKARHEICKTCDELKHDSKGTYCGACGCGTITSLAIRDLCHYEERLPDWGCKHPRRSKGHG